MKRTFLTFVILFSIVSLSSSPCLSDEIKTLDDFQNSTFVKKYPQSKPMESWALKKGGYNNSFIFDLKADKSSQVFLDVQTRSQTDSIIIRYSMLFHSGYMNKMTTFFNDFFSVIDSTIDTKAVIDYVKKEASVMRNSSYVPPMKTFGKYTVKVNNRMNGVIVTIDR